MKLSRVFSIVVALVVVISVLVIWFQSSVEDFMDANSTWNGVKDFVIMFNASTIDSMSSLDSVPPNSTLVVIPSLKYSNSDLARIGRFVNGGGTLILMDDFGDGNEVLASLGIPARFAPGVLLDPLFCYKNPELPIIVFFSPSLSVGSVKAVDMNRATSLENVGNGEVLASSSEMSFMDLNGNGTLDKNEPKGPFPVAAKYHLNAGIVEVVSDPSIIINTMLPLDENAEFMGYLIKAQAGDSQVYIDKSHLISSPLDTAKVKLVATRKIVSNPFVLLGVLALVFVFVSLNAAEKDGKVD
jgi:hypothetical protein